MRNKTNKKQSTQTFRPLDPYILFFSLLFSLFSFSLTALSLDETLSFLSSSADAREVQFRYDPFLKNGVITAGDHYGVFTVASKDGESGYLLLNNRELFNVPLPYQNKGTLVFPEKFVETLKTNFTRLYEYDASRFRVSTIVIDPGHGGRDPGAVGTHTINGKRTEIYEKDIVLSVGLALRDKLNETYPDKRIIMTRDNDTYLSLDQRADMANAVTVKENESVIFISIHANAALSANPRGYEVWHITTSRRQRRNLLDSSQHNLSPDITAILEGLLEEEYTTESILLADSILNGFDKSFKDELPSRGRKANDWFVVKNSRMPAVLVELGFVSNRHDTLLMTSREGLQKMTESLYDGIINFVGIFER